jgi:hypothetical protein
MVRFVNSGTEAVMSAIRLARAATGRDLIVKCIGCYHGHSDSLLVEAGSGALTLGTPSTPGVPKSVTAATALVHYNDLDRRAGRVPEVPRPDRLLRRRAGRRPTWASSRPPPATSRACGRCATSTARCCCSTR